jgi:tetrathionate reductase subunit B
MRGELPACVDACPYGARIFGDLNDSNSEIRKIMDTEPVQVLSPERGTKPKVFYIALNRSTAETMGGKYEELG